MMIIVRVFVVNRGAPAAQQQVSIKYVSGLIQTISLSRQERNLFVQPVDPATRRPIPSRLLYNFPHKSSNYTYTVPASLKQQPPSLKER